jgi:cell division protein FtsB
MVRRIGIVAAIVAVAMAYALLDRETGMRTLLQLHGEVERDRARAAALRARNDALHAEARALESDPFAIESAIREDLALGRADDVIVRFPPSESSNP